MFVLLPLKADLICIDGLYSFSNCKLNMYITILQCINYIISTNFGSLDTWLEWQHEAGFLHHSSSCCAPGCSCMPDVLCISGWRSVYDLSHRPPADPAQSQSPRTWVWSGTGARGTPRQTGSQTATQTHAVLGAIISALMLQELPVSYFLLGFRKNRCTMSTFNSILK